MALSLFMLITSIFIIKYNTDNINKTNLYNSKLINIEKNYFNKQCDIGNQTAVLLV